ncbi:MAG: SDR family NAD(P)-dependent oxidoreductase [Pseudonocardia sp.]|nr:SDR family NAD(P)-dependent oxidoreductase [Pseudonocardia sp.]
MSTSQVTAALDLLADATVGPGYTRLGYLLRQAQWPAHDPRPQSLAGKTALVTGANSGLGYITSVELARLGARVILACRDCDRGTSALRQARRAAPTATFELRICDIANLASLRQTGHELAHTTPVLDLLIHCAGVLPAQRGETPEGHEITLATHVLGPLLLTELLRGNLTAAHDSRVIFVSSGGMYTQRLHAEDPEYRHGIYRGATAYARTKRMQVELTPLLAQRYKPNHITVAAMHPGWVDTPGIATSLPTFYRLTRPLLRTPLQGADTITWLAATQPTPPTGLFWHDRRARPTHYLPHTRSTPKQITKLWNYCVDAINLTNP